MLFLLQNRSHAVCCLIIRAPEEGVKQLFISTQVIQAQVGARCPGGTNKISLSYYKGHLVCIRSSVLLRNRENSQETKSDHSAHDHLMLS